MLWPWGAVSLLGRACDLDTGKTYALQRQLREHSALHLRNLRRLTTDRRQQEEGELRNKNPPTPCLWCMPLASARQHPENQKGGGKPRRRRSARWRARRTDASPVMSPVLRCSASDPGGVGRNNAKIGITQKAATPSGSYGRDGRLWKSCRCESPTPRWAEATPRWPADFRCWRALANSHGVGGLTIEFIHLTAI